jgi:hypothetical protein
MGRGFKEMLCLARHAEVHSGPKAVLFIVEQGRRVTRMVPLKEPMRGALVQMAMPWKPAIIPPLETYFQRFLVPPGIQLTINGVSVKPREVAHQIETSLPTELFEEGRWIRPGRKTTVELIHVNGDEEPTVYELGIPVCPVDWTVPYHANILQRVPMNPCRDAVASGYLLKLHRCCLPTLLPEMDGQEVRQDWVGAAVPHCDDAVQKQVIDRAFGPNIARSVPRMGVRQFDEDARDLGVQVIDTKQTSGGFREVLQQHIPTTRALVDQHNQNLVTAAASSRFTLDELDKGEDAQIRKRQDLIAAAGGKEQVQQVMEFARWFCQKLLDGYEDAGVCSVTLALLKPVNAIATWSQEDVLTLGLDTSWLWTDPLGEETLATLVHETAHAQNAHHGRDFHKEMEKPAGRAARMMFIWADFIKKEFASLLDPGR